eukprot:4493076-Pleurochrysis_carterae.AAC.4
MLGVRMVLAGESSAPHLKVHATKLCSTQIGAAFTRHFLVCPRAGHALARAANSAVIARKAAARVPLVPRKELGPVGASAFSTIKADAATRDELNFVVRRTRQLCIRSD